MSNLISPNQLAEKINNKHLIIIDCRANLTDPTAGPKLYAAGHIKNAIHAHLENDLSAEIIPGKTGRHPLPEQEQWQATLRKWGAEKESLFVVYDQNSGVFAARAWWMLKWAGFESVQLLNGGLDAWIAAGFGLSREVSKRQTSNITISVNNQMTVSAHQLNNLSNQVALLDARALPRYRGEVEPLDAHAGHIPGAQNADFMKNLNEQGTFLSADELKQRFQPVADKDVICYCGSGASACHNVLAFLEAGLPMPKLYPGSWSEWITDDNRERATGTEGGVL